jgi:hypothetical protein
MIRVSAARDASVIVASPSRLLCRLRLSYVAVPARHQDRPVATVQICSGTPMHCRCVSGHNAEMMPCAATVAGYTASTRSLNNHGVLHVQLAAINSRA